MDPTTQELVIEGRTLFEKSSPEKVAAARVATRLIFESFDRDASVDCEDQTDPVGAAATESEPDAVPEQVPAQTHRPDEQELRLLAEHGIRFDGRYHYGPFHGAKLSEVAPFVPGLRLDADSSGA